MKRGTLIITVFTVVLVAIALAAAWYLVDSSQRLADSFGTEEDNIPMTPGDAIYVSGDYGFMLQYPESATVSETFAQGYHLPALWRASAGPDSVGTPIVSFTTYSTKSETSYPRYFDALIRIGASTDKKEVTRCLSVAADQGEIELTDIVMGGTTWKAFSFENAGMQQYVRGISYRTVREGTCFAIEKLAVGSSYREGASERDIPQATLDAEYAQLERIIKTVTFVNP
jgi:hypothetical protein